MKDVWIGLVEVASKAPNEVLDGCLGGFSNFITMAACEKDFRENLRKKTEKLLLDVVKVDWAQPINHRHEEYGVEEYLLELADSVRKDGQSRFGRFHLWGNE